MRPNRTLIFATICSLTCCQIGLANDIFVNSVSTGGSKDGSSWEDAFLFVHDGLNAASAGDTVHVAEGVYYADEGFLIPVDSREFSFTLPEDTTLLGGYDISGQNRDPDTFLTILSGDVTKDDLDSDGNQIAETATQLVGNNAIHVVVIPAAGVVDGFVITAGQANESALSFGSSGGGLLTTGKGATVRNCQFAGNTASGRGGAVMASDADTQFINCSFYGNVAGARGGAFGTLDGATPHLINCVFSGNQSQRGGALNFNDSEPVLTNCSISGNSGTVNGGGIQAAVNSVVTLENTIVWNNLANGSASAGGSSINLISSSTSSVTTCLIENSGGSDPMFVTPPDPALAPSPTGNLQLMRGSPATEAGTDELNTEPFDFAGEDRIFGTGIDIGAFEFSPQIFVDQSATGANNGSSWKDAYTKLQDGLAVAAPEDQVRVAAGIYYPDEGIGQTDNDRESSFEIGSGVSLLGGYPNGGGSSNASIHLTVLSGDLQKNDVNLDGNRIAEDTAQLIGDNAYSVVTVDGVEDVVISGFTITAGLADGAGRGRDSGAGIYGFESDVRVMDCRMIGNLAKFSGGGITVSGSLPAELQLIRCEFFSNGVNVGAGFGGGGCFFSGTELMVSRCTFRTNSAAGGSAMTVSGATLCEIEDSMISDHIGEFSSVVSLLGADVVALTRTTISGNDNSAALSNSRAILTLANLPSCTFRDCLISGNKTGNEGSLMFISTLTGGGDVPQSINFTSTTIAGNDALSLVKDNTAMGILSFGNCFVGIPVDTTDSFSVFRANSLIAGQPADGNGNLADTTDPGFVSPEPAASAPTTAGNYQLLFSSPLVEAGGAATASTIDLLGSPRFFDADNNNTATIDIGAYEFHGSSTTADVETTGVAYNENSGQVVLTVESSAATTFTAQFSPDLSTSTWADFLSGSLNAGTNSVVIEGSFYGWPRDDAFFRIATP